MMKVLNVIPNLASRNGGPAVTVVESALALRDLGVEASVFGTDLSESANAPNHGRVAASDLPSGADALDVRLFPARWPYRLAFSPALHRALVEQAGEYDVVHIHSLFLFPQFSAYRGAVRHGVPYLVSPCGALDPYLRNRSRVVKAVNDAAWQRRMLSQASALHYKTEAEAELVADLGLAPPAVVVPNGIRWSEFQNLPSGEEFRNRYLGGHEGRVVLNLGRLSFKKGLDILIRAFAIVRREAPDARLVIAGPDDEGLRPRLERLAEHEGVAAAVTFTGMLRGASKLAALASADVWALPSHTENFGMAVVEALAAGRPTVISPAVNISADVAAADAGVVVELTPAAFAEAIGSLLADEARRAQLGERARKFARRYDWSAVAPQFAAMYAGVAGRG